MTEAHVKFAAPAITSFESFIVGTSVDWFNGERHRAEELLKVLSPENKGGPSLRLIDFAVVHYARKFHATLWASYRRRLSALSKRYFDVFRRRSSVEVDILDTRVSTSFAQLNFFYFFFSSGADIWVQDNAVLLKREMKRNEGKKRNKLYEPAGDDDPKMVVRENKVDPTLSF